MTILLCGCPICSGELREHFKNAKRIQIPQLKFNMENPTIKKLLDAKQTGNTLKTTQK